MAVLVGADIDLRLLAHCFTTDQCRVSNGSWPDIGDGEFYILSAMALDLVPKIIWRKAPNGRGEQIDFPDDETLNHAREEANRLVNAMNGAARLIEPGYHAVSVGSVHKFTFDGQYMGGSAKSSMRDGWRNYSMPSEKAGLTELVRLWAQEGIDSEPVALALTMYGTMPVTWTMLYMVYEIIRGNMNGDLATMITDSRLKQFTKAANNARSLQQGPRHAKKTELKPDDLISLDEGERIIRHLLNHWLGEKVGKFMSYG